MDLKTSWKGLVGLIFPSDYGFSTSGDCSEILLSAYSGTCANASWIHKGYVHTLALVLSELYNQNKLRNW